jgi:hypothetical protein
MTATTATRYDVFLSHNSSDIRRNRAGWQQQIFRRL